MSRPYLVGLTGGLASGKSTVASLLRDAGFTVVDADDIVAELHRPGGAGAEAVRELFGAEALDEDGAVDREAVAARIFSDPAARGRLEAALHPLVRRRFAELVARSNDGESGVAVLEATLLVEAGYTEDFDLVIDVEADPEVRLERAVARGMPEAAARARLEAQGDGATRRAAADRIIRNDGTPEELRAEVDALIAELRASALALTSEEIAER